MVIQPETPKFARRVHFRDLSNRQIRRRIENIFHSNQIYGLKPSEVEIVRKRGVTYIDARYEVRMPLLWRIDAIIRFDDLLYPLGESKPIDRIP